jgi:hypothetical protein
MELYCGKISSQSEFGNIFFKLIEVVTVLIYSSRKYSFLAFFSPINPDLKWVNFGQKRELNKAYLGSKLMHRLGLRGFLMLGFIEE